MHLCIPDAEGSVPVQTQPPVVWMSLGAWGGVPVPVALLVRAFSGMVELK